MTLLPVSSRIDHDIGCLEREPDLSALHQVQLLQSGGCYLGHQRDIAVDANANPVPHQLDVACLTRPHIAWTALGAPSVDRYRPRMNDREHLA